MLLLWSSSSWAQRPPPPQKFDLLQLCCQRGLDTDKRPCLGPTLPSPTDRPTPQKRVKPRLKVRCLCQVLFPLRPPPCTAYKQSPPSADDMTSSRDQLCLSGAGDRGTAGSALGRGDRAQRRHHQGQKSKCISFYARTKSRGIADNLSMKQYL